MPFNAVLMRPVLVSRRRFREGAYGGLAEVVAAVFLSQVEIKLNCEPLAGFRWRSSPGLHERHGGVASGTLPRDWAEKWIVLKK